MAEPAAPAKHPAPGRVPPRPIPVGPRDIASILDRGVAEAADAEALVDAAHRYTYRALDAAVDRAAARLVELGADAGVRIACSAPNGCDIVIAFLAAQRIGAIWVGLNRALPPREKARLAAHAGALLFLGDATAIAEIAPFRAEVPTLADIAEMDPAGAWLTKAKAPFARRAIDPHAIAAINYTSGTTGEPKGILHSQHTLLTPVAAITAFGLVGAALRRGVILPLTITNVMVIGPLIALANSTACVCAPSARIAELLPWIDAERIEALSAVSALIYDLAAVETPPPLLRTVISGGAPLSLASAERFRERYGFWPTNTYGLTEAPTIVTETRGRGDAPEGTSGLPLPHMALTIRDEQGQALPAGETGEICIEATAEGEWTGVYSPLLGYWRDPERSAVLATTPWLRTGDIGHLDADGWLFVSDRKSELILRGGSNVYPQEIIRVIETDARVAACAVVGVPDERLGERTFAFVQPAEGVDDEADLVAALRAICREHLSGYKCPDFWQVMAPLPRNPGGKVILPELRRLALTLIDKA